MKQAIRKRLPSGFRHLFSKREIKALEEQASVRFTQISFGHLLNSTTFRKEQLVQSEFHPVTVHGYKKEDKWALSIHQSGFREELLPREHEPEIKTRIKYLITNYLSKIIASQETDFLQRPQLRIDVIISSDQIQVHTRESK